MSDTISFTLDGEKIEAQTDETIWEIAKRAATRSRTCAIATNQATAPTPTAAPAWSKSTANVCWLPRAAARQRRA